MSKHLNVANHLTELVVVIASPSSGEGRIDFDDPSKGERPEQLLRQDGGGPPFEGGSPTVTLPGIQIHHVGRCRRRAEPQKWHPDSIVCDADGSCLPAHTSLKVRCARVTRGKGAEEKDGEAFYWGVHGRGPWRRDLSLARSRGL
jgi:hypothetical protein